MASNYKHTRTVTDTIKVKGYLTGNGDDFIIEFEDGKDNTSTVSVLDLFSPFADEEIVFSISRKEETDLEEESA